MGVSGHVGLAQMHIDSISRTWRRDNTYRKPASDIRRLLLNAISKDFSQIMQAAKPLSDAIGPQAALQYETSSLVALPAGGSTGHLELFECEMTGVSTASTEDLPYVAIGSGKVIADPFLAFLRRIFWPKAPLRLSEGLFSTVWALLHSIELSPGGISEPIQVAMLRQGPQNRPTVEVLSPDHLVEHRQHVQDAEDYMRRYEVPPSTDPPPTLVPPGRSSTDT